ncbi:MAG: hypothetical protein ACRELG_11795 [Gemmataceae bacterium]
MARSRIRLCLEQLEDRVLPSAAPDIQMTFATTTDSRTISVNYNITGASLAGQNVSFNVYRSSAYDSLNGAQLLGTATISASDSADLGVGSHQGVKLSLTEPNGQPVTALTPNTALPFIVVVANSDGSTASFETHVLGVISHGLELDPTLWWLNQVPAWELQMAAALQQSDGYEAVLPFNWIRLSFLPFPLAIQLAGSELYQQVVAEADQLASQHPGDVVDINFIGHSRGTVVISEVLQDLVGTNDPALRGGYMQMTLLDPHPANLSFTKFSWDPSIPAANDFAALVVWFELLTRDPQVVVPSNVMQTQLFDEQTPAGQLGFHYPSEILLNFWGETASAIPDQSAQPVEEQNLTNVTAAGIGLIGHSEVHDWYLANVVDANETFTYFG